jgi:hypothetical protein
MRFRATCLLAAAGVTLGLATTPAFGQIEVVSADADYARFHPKPVVASEAPSGDFTATMDKVFGAGRWRQTSGYRTKAQEDALRRQGAGTVAPGHTSLHSIGGPQAPGAYDAVVAHLTPAQAAAKLQQSAGGAFRVLAERAHGPQGPHLHVERVSARTARAPAETATDD